MAPKKKAPPPPKVARTFTTPKVNKDCKFGDTKCYEAFWCVACTYELLVGEGVPLGRSVWGEYNHPRATANKPNLVVLEDAAKKEVPPPPAEIEKKKPSPTTTVQPTESNNTIRRLASGTLVEVNPQGRVVRTLKEGEV